MTIGFRMYAASDGSLRYMAHTLSSEVEIEETMRAVAVIESTGAGSLCVAREKLPVVVAALRLAGFEVK